MAASATCIGEQRRLDAVDTGHGLRRRHRVGHREPGLAGDHWLDLRDSRGKHRFGRQQLRAHRRPLRTLAGEHPHRTPIIAPDRGLIRSIALGDLAQSLGELRPAARNDGGAYRAVRAPTRQGVGQIRQRHVVMCLPPSQPAGRRCGAVRRPRWTTAETAVVPPPPFRLPRRGLQRFRGSREPAPRWRAHWFPTPHTTTPPPGVDAGRCVGHGVISCGTKSFVSMRASLIRQTGEVQIRWNNTMLQSEHRLHQPQSSGGRLGMAEIGLHRCQRARALDAVYLGQAGVFDGVTDRGTGAVRLDHADAAGIHARSGQRRLIHGGLRAQRRCRDVHGVAVLVCGRATHHRQDPVAIPQRIRQPLEQHHCAALATHVPVRRDVERMTASRGRQMALRPSLRRTSAVPASRRRRPRTPDRFRRRSGCDRPYALRAGQKNMQCPPSARDRGVPGCRRSARTPC